MSTLAAITIICGACHCASVAPNVQPCEYAFVMKQPKVWELTGTALTITYDVAHGSYTVQDGDAQDVVFDADEAETAAMNMVARLRSVGVQP